MSETQSPPASQPSDRPAYRRATYLLSAPGLQHCPKDSLREVAFVGRSNAGKSSAINTLTGQPGLARTSKTPGRTQLLNFFTVGQGLYLVDLPGFGYAKVPLPLKRKWQQQLERYLRERKTLRGLVLLMDIRHPFTEFDNQMIAWTRQARLPLHLLLTKADKLSRGAAKGALLQARRTLADLAPEASVQLFSSLKSDGVDELRKQLDLWLWERPPAPGGEPEAEPRQEAAEHSNPVQPEPTSQGDARQESQTDSGAAARGESDERSGEEE